MAIAQWNEYEILEEQAGCYLLKCTLFNCEEDLGDRIMATHQGQKLWVAGYFVRHMPCFAKYSTSATRELTGAALGDTVEASALCRALRT